MFETEEFQAPPAAGTAGRQCVWLFGVVVGWTDGRIEEGDEWVNHQGDKHAKFNESKKPEKSHKTHTQEQQLAAALVELRALLVLLGVLLGLVVLLPD